MALVEVCFSFTAELRIIQKSSTVTLKLTCLVKYIPHHSLEVVQRTWYFTKIPRHVTQQKKTLSALSPKLGSIYQPEIGCRNHSIQQERTFKSEENGTQFIIEECQHLIRSQMRTKRWLETT